MKTLNIRGIQRNCTRKRNFITHLNKLLRKYAENIYENNNELSYIIIMHLLFCSFSYSSKKPTLNLGVWMPADYHMPPPNIHMIGRFSLGRFGWFTPKKLIKTDQPHPPPLPYTIFKTNTGEQFKRFLVNTTVLKELLVFLN